MPGRKSDWTWQTAGRLWERVNGSKNHMYIPFLGFFILKKYKFLEWIVSTAYESSDGPPSHMVLQDVKPWETYLDDERDPNS